jgi:hypothetical protein
MSRFKLTLDLFVEADTESQARDKVVAWVQNQGPSSCWDWRASGVPVSLEAGTAKKERWEALTTWGHGHSGSFVIEAEQRDIFTFYRVREHGLLWTRVFKSSAEAEQAVEKAEAEFISRG